jgi:hypothetical protein
LGIADVGDGLALCKAPDELIVLRLSDGEVLWREAIDARPLLVGRGLALVLNAGEVLAYSLEDKDHGALRWRVSLPTMPTEAEAAWIDDEAAVHWRSRERYRGGAHPGLPTDRDTQSGQCCIRLGSGSARPLAQWPERPDPPQWEASDDPSVLASCVLGGTRYQVASTPGGKLNELRLSATRASDNRVIWERQLGAFAPRPAPRLRP